MSHYAQVYCTEKGIEVFGFCPEWFKETYYKPIYSKDEIENISKALQDIFDDDDSQLQEFMTRLISLKSYRKIICINLLTN